MLNLLYHLENERFLQCNNSKDWLQKQLQISPTIIEIGKNAIDCE